MANPISKKLKYINKNGEEKEITLYDNPASFSDYDGGNYIAVQTDTNTVGYIYCNSDLQHDTDLFAKFLDKSGNVRYAYNKEQEQDDKTLIAKYTFTTGYDVMPQINGVVYSSKYKDTINGNGTTTRKLFSNKPITQINFSNVTNAQHLLTVDYINTSEITDMDSIFYNCTALTSLNLSNSDTSKVTNMRYAFRNCTALTSLNMSNFDTSKVTNTKFMFTNVKSTCKIYVNKNKFTRTASQCYFSGSFTYV